MRCLFPSVRPRHRPGLDCGNAKHSVCGHRHTTVSLETGLQRLVLGVFRMVIFSMRIGLPDFQNRIWHRNSVAVENSPLNGYALSGNTFANQVVTVLPLEANLEKRPNRLRRGRLQTHLFLHRRRFAPPQNDIELVTQRVFRHRSFPVEPGDQPVAGFFIRRAVENRIKRN